MKVVSQYIFFWKKTFHLKYFFLDFIILKFPLFSTIPLDVWIILLIILLVKCGRVFNKNIEHICLYFRARSRKILNFGSVSLDTIFQRKSFHYTRFDNDAKQQRRRSSWTGGSGVGTSSSRTKSGNWKETEVLSKKQVLVSSKSNHFKMNNITEIILKWKA